MVMARSNVGGGSGSGNSSGRTRVGRYELGRTLGEGTFAKVKFARNVETGENVAIKILDKEKVLKHKMIGQVLFDSCFLLNLDFNFHDLSLISCCIRWIFGVDFSILLSIVYLVLFVFSDTLQKKLNRWIKSNQEFFLVKKIIPSRRVFTDTGGA